MIACDVNLLLYALREESDRHVEYRAWLEKTLEGDEPVALFEPVLAGVLRIGTHPAVYRTPPPRGVVEAYIETLIAAPAAMTLRAGDHHWALFLALCRKADCRGNMVQDAYLAALALEHGCRWMTTDRDFARFPSLVWKHPLDNQEDIKNPE
jgi:toxin-antitoxin system PIN domain toxin